MLNTGRLDFENFINTSRYLYVYVCDYLCISIYVYPKEKLEIKEKVIV